MCILLCVIVCVGTLWYLFFSSRRRHTRCALVTGVQTCALPISCSKLNERGSGDTNLVPSDAIYKAAAEKLVRRQLRDPESAIFSDMYVVGPRPDRSAVVCGTVNSRNGFGGMAGGQRFIVGPTIVFKGQDEVVLEEWVGKERMDLERPKSC